MADLSAEDFRTKEVFTTGEAAEICKISQQTIIRCFDAGRLNGFKVPGSRFRRIPRGELLRFMRDNSIPIDALEAEHRRVLVVDDDPDILELYRDLLESEGGFEVRTVGSGYEAGVETERFRPELILLDYMLPDVNGNQVCKTIRAQPEHGGIKIIIVSGVVNPEEIDALLAAGADAFIKKPFDVDQLLGKVRELLAII